MIKWYGKENCVFDRGDRKYGMGRVSGTARESWQIRCQGARASEQKEPEEMTIRELREYISILEKQQTPAYKQWCEIFMRINIPLASFFFAMIGACLGTQKQRTSSSIGLGISIIVIFIYYAVMTFTSGLGKGGALPPFLACAIPNILCLGIGLYLMKKKSV